jgi:hypothetical protein
VIHLIAGLFSWLKVISKVLKSLNKKTKPPAKRQKCHKMSGLKGKTSIYA